MEVNTRAVGAPESAARREFAGNDKQSEIELAGKNSSCDYSRCDVLLFDAGAGKIAGG